MTRTRLHAVHLTDDEIAATIAALEALPAPYGDAGAVARMNAENKLYAALHPDAEHDVEEAIRKRWGPPHTPQGGPSITTSAQHAATSGPGREKNGSSESRERHTGGTAERVR